MSQDDIDRAIMRATSLLAEVNQVKPAEAPSDVHSDAAAENVEHNQRPTEQPASEGNTG